MARARMPVRAVRVDTPTWDAALRTADRRAENLPDVIRAFLARYAREELRAARTAPKPVAQVSPECICVYSCADDPATACSLSGEFHTHPADATGVFGPCPIHPEAPAS